MPGRRASIVLACTLMAACASVPRAVSGSVFDAATIASAPRAATREHWVESPHGRRRDDYYWLRDDDNRAKRPEVMRHLEAENAYTAAVLAPQAPLVEKLFAEMRSRIDDDDSTVPAWDNGWWYWRRFVRGAEHPQVLRARGTPAGRDADARDELLIDGPARARGQPFYSIGGVAVSPDNRWLAWTEDTQGRRIGTLRLRDLASGTVLDEKIDGVLEEVVWAADSRTIFYLKQDPVLLQTGPVYRHVLGTDPARDALVYDEPDDTLFTRLRRSASREFVTIAVGGFHTTEHLVVPAARPAEPPRVVLPRRPGVRAYADHLDGRWVIRTNENARNFRLVDAPGDAPADRSRWRELVPHRADAAIERFALFQGAIAIQERVEANARIAIVPWGGEGKPKVVAADDPAYAMELAEDQHPSLRSVRYKYESMIAPESVFDAALSNGERTVRKVDPVPGYRRERYRAERVWLPARDGARIPVSLAYCADRFARDGSAPMLLFGYGAYGASYDPYLNKSAISLMDRGFVVAIAHVRGGAELGQDWYEDGRLTNKKNTFFDFIDATRGLVAAGWAARDKVFGNGGSGGGLLIGAVANMAGTEYRALNAQVPFVDLMTTMLDPTIPLTVNEWTQWGDPREKAAYDYMLSYSPYDNVERKAYPAMFVTTGLWDSQVQYYEPAKWVARLRANKTDANPLLFHIDLDAGHGGKSGRFERLRVRAMEYAFFLGLLDIRD